MVDAEPVVAELAPFEALELSAPPSVLGFRSVIVSPGSCPGYEPGRWKSLNALDTHKASLAMSSLRTQLASRASTAVMPLKSSKMREDFEAQMLNRYGAIDLGCRRIGRCRAVSGVSQGTRRAAAVHSDVRRTRDHPPRASGQFAGFRGVIAAKASERLQTRVDPSRRWWPR